MVIPAHRLISIHPRPFIHLPSPLSMWCHILRDDVTLPQPNLYVLRRRTGHDPFIQRACWHAKPSSGRERFDATNQPFGLASNSLPSPHATLPASQRCVAEKCFEHALTALPRPAKEAMEPLEPHPPSPSRGRTISSMSTVDKLFSASSISRRITRLGLSPVPFRDPGGCREA